MGLRTKFNLILITCLLLGFLAVFWFYQKTTLHKAELKLTHQAELAFEITEAIRSYNQAEVTPLLGQLDQGFLPQNVGSYAVSQIMAKTHETVPKLQHKVAIEDSEIDLYRPNIWQQKIINAFKANKNLPVLTNRMADAQGRFLAYAKPILSDQQVIGAKIIRLNENDTHNAINSELLNFGLTLLGLFLLIVLILNLLMNRMVLNPLRRMSIQASAISQGQSEADEINVIGSDEISQIAESFNRMQRSLKAAMGMLS